METYEEAPPAPRGQRRRRRQQRRQQRPHHVSPGLRTALVAVRTVLLLCSLYLLGVFIDQYLRRPVRGGNNGRNLNNPQLLAVLILAAVSTGWSLCSLLGTCVWHAAGAATVMAAVDAVNSGAMVAVAVLLRDYASPGVCANHGIGMGAGTGNMVRCRLLRGAFGVSVGAAVLFMLAAFLSLLLAAAFRRARPFGPSPDNDYHVGYNQPPKRRGFITPDLPRSSHYDADPVSQRYSTATTTTSGAGTLTTGGREQVV